MRQRLGAHCASHCARSRVLLRWTTQLKGYGLPSGSLCSGGRGGHRQKWLTVKGALSSARKSARGGMQEREMTEEPQGLLEEVEFEQGLEG